MTKLDAEICIEPNSPEELRTLLRQLRRKRQRQKTAAGARRRSAMGRKQRTRVLAKTGGRCHICGGLIQAGWQADHVLAHSGGGHHVEDNYLPAHALCNNYRWDDYLAEEFQVLADLGDYLEARVDGGGGRCGENVLAGFVTGCVITHWDALIEEDTPEDRGRPAGQLRCPGCGHIRVGCAMAPCVARQVAGPVTCPRRREDEGHSGCSRRTRSKTGAAEGFRFARFLDVRCGDWCRVGTNLTPRGVASAKGRRPTDTHDLGFSPN